MSTPVRFLPVIAVVLLGACSGSNASSAPSPSAGATTDGIHIDGAIHVIYPIGNAGNCSVATLNSMKILQFTGKSQNGAVVGMEVFDYKGPATYAKLGWPPYSTSALWVGILPEGRTWRAYSGEIVVKSDRGGTLAGTLAATRLREVNGDTTVNARGSWTCSEKPPSSA